MTFAIRHMTEGYLISVSDADLVTALNRLRDGDRDSLRGLYELTASSLYPVVARILKDEDKACDALREVYTQLVEKTADAHFQPRMVDLILLARRTALDHKIAGESIRRIPTTPVQPSVEASSKLKPSQATLLLRILDNAQHHHSVNRKTEERFDRLQTRLKVLTGGQGHHE